MFAHGEIAGFLLALANEQDRMHLVGLRAADACANFVGSRVGADTNAVLSQFGDDIIGLVDLLVAKRQQTHLVGSEPEREIAGVVLDQ